MKGLQKEWTTGVCVCTHTCTDLLHLGIEVGVAICNNELDCFIGYLFIRGFHGDAPDKVHPGQVKAFHTLKSDHDTLNINVNQDMFNLYSYVQCISALTNKETSCASFVKKQNAEKHVSKD